LRQQEIKALNLIKQLLDGLNSKNEKTLYINFSCSSLEAGLSGLPIKTWLQENEKIVVNEREDEQYHQSYWVRPKKRGATTPVT